MVRECETRERRCWERWDEEGEKQNKQKIRVLDRWTETERGIMCSSERSIPACGWLAVGLTALLHYLCGGEGADEKVTGGGERLHTLALFPAFSVPMPVACCATLASLSPPAICNEQAPRRHGTLSLCLCFSSLDTHSPFCSRLLSRSLLGASRLAHRHASSRSQRKPVSVHNVHLSGPLHCYWRLADCDRGKGRGQRRRRAHHERANPIYAKKTAQSL